MRSPSRLPRALVFWLFLAVVAIVTGALRESLLRPLVGEPWAHWIGTLVLCAIFILCFASVMAVAIVKPRVVLAVLVQVIGLQKILAHVLPIPSVTI